jgi:hypothetical protein
VYSRGSGGENLLSRRPCACGQSKSKRQREEQYNRDLGHAGGQTRSPEEDVDRDDEDQGGGEGDEQPHGNPDAMGVVVVDILVVGLLVLFWQREDKLHIINMGGRWGVSKSQSSWWR